jgi:hypothetical protein
MNIDSVRFNLDDLLCDMDNSKYKYINIVNELIEYTYELQRYNDELNSIIKDYENYTKNSNSI